jgi:hypothetical protein
MSDESTEAAGAVGSGVGAAGPLPSPRPAAGARKNPLRYLLKAIDVSDIARDTHRILNHRPSQHK